MSDQFLGEIRCFGFNFAPYGWALCNGQILPISQYSALFSLLGTNFGGNGTSNFGLPNLQSRVALDVGTLQGGSTYVVGEQAGSENVTLIANNLPAHTHAFNIGVAPYVAGDYSKQPVSLVTWPGELVDQS
jgi:microcystin-dependent protein